MAGYDPERSFWQPRLAQAVKVDVDAARVLGRDRCLQVGEREVGLSPERFLEGLARFHRLAEIT
jgi:hypothetical protein